LAEKELDETSTAQTHIQQASDILSQAMTEMRQLIWTLRPTALDDMGLVPALHELVNTFATKSSVTISLQGDEHLPHLPPATETALYRIAQEAIANSLQHAQATQISVALRQHQETIHLTIIDDGTRTTKRSPSEVNSENREPHPHLRGLGLWSMQERAAEIGGTFSIHTIPGQGTEVMVSAPLNQGRTPR
jgi:signal transduction histidine kinase